MCRCVLLGRMALHTAHMAARLLVKDAYEKVVRGRFNRHVKANLPPAGKLADNAMAFFKLSRSRKATLEELMGEALVVYSEDWCRKAFRTPWPPLSVVLSDKTRAKIGENVVEVVEVSPQNRTRIVSRYLEVLRSMDRKDAIECVKGGWPPGPEAVRRALIKELTNA